MTLPAYLPPMVATQNQMTISVDDTARRRPSSAAEPAATAAPARPPSGEDILRALQQPDKAQASDTALTGGQKAPVPPEISEASIGADLAEKQAIAVQQLSSIRTRSGETKAVNLPVPVTQILQIVMYVAPDQSAASTGAKALYEGIQSMFSDGGDAPAPAVVARDETPSQLAA